MSEYARGSTHWLQVAAFVLWAMASVGCVVLALRAAPPGRRIARAIVAGALAACALGLLVAAANTTQTIGGELPAGVRRTTGGRLHDLGTLFILGGLVVAGIASMRLLRSWRYRLQALALAVALVAAVPVLVLLRWDAPGVGQRAFILVGIAWQWAFACASATRGRCRLPDPG